MSPLLGPILAQLVTLGVSDRSEARYIVTDENYAEVATAPRVGLNFAWKHATLSFGYGPSITVTPLEAKDPSVLIFHGGTIAMSNSWARTTVSANESLGYGKVDFRDQALADPRTAPATSAPVEGTGTTMGMPTTGTTPPANGGTTGTGAQPQPGPAGAIANQYQALDRPVTFSTSVTSVNVSQLVSAVLTVTGGISYLITGGQDEAYPSVKGPGARLAASYRPTRFDNVTTSLSTQFAESSDGNNAYVLFANEAWTHQFSPSTASSFGAGLSLTRNSQPDGTIYYSIYPNFALGLTNSTLLGRNTLTFGTSVSSAPFIDPVLALVDPRLSAAIFATLRRGAFATSIFASSAISLQTHDDNSTFDAINGGLNLSYVLAKGVSVDTGVRESWQTYAGQATIPLSLAAYVGVTLGAVVPLNGTH